MTTTFTDEQAIIAVAKELANAPGLVFSIGFTPHNIMTISMDLKLDCISYINFNGQIPEQLLNNLPFVRLLYKELLTISN